MKSNFSPAAFRYFISSVFLAANFFAFLHTASAQINNQAAAKPKAILIADWNGQPDHLSQVKPLPLQVRGQTQASNRTKFSALPTAGQTKQFAAAANSISSRFASLKPTPLEEQAFTLVNEQRLLQHLAPLVWDLEMLYLAREHSENMAQLNFFSHQGQDGKMTDDRANAIGVTDWRGIGENIAFSQGVRDSVETAVRDWTNSQHHKENMLDKRWTRSGIGIAQSPEGKFYITQVFRD